MSDSVAIAAEDLVKEYGETRALDGFSVSVDRGEFFGLLGPNGAGKTTFIETLVGLSEPTAGTAEVFGHDVVADRRAVRQQVGLAPQEYNVDRFFPIREVLEHKAGYHGFPRETAKERADWALDRVGLQAKAGATFKSLSGGMKRRVLLARALVTDPDLLILDEPTAGVDVQLRREIWEVVQDLNEGGTTVLLTTHYIEEAERLCDRVCIMEAGRSVAVDTPAELRRRGTDTHHLRLDGRPSQGVLDGIEEVVSVERTADGLAVEASRSSGAVPAMITALTEAGVTVTDVETEPTTLEDVFVDMTRTDSDRATPARPEEAGGPDRSGDRTGADRDLEVTR
ncbi:MAG: ABC transporter ATP-binding protein [Haloarculaceae archaeon]